MFSGGCRTGVCSEDLEQINVSHLLRMPTQHLEKEKKNSHVYTNEEHSCI